jgi:hypothetical protein
MQMRRLRSLFAPMAIVIVAMTACSELSQEHEFTLYRNSVADENMRIRVATFDATDGEPYNRANCEQAQLLFQAQPSIKTKFWCEKGQFKK